jgi:hypothetical protein
MGSKERLRDDWKQLPLFLKILVAVTILNILCSPLFLGNPTYIILGLFVYGLIAYILQLLLNVIGAAVAVLAIWKRYPWAWKYCVGYYGFFVINGIIGMISFAGKIPEGFHSYLLPSILFGVISVIFSIFFLLIIVKEKKFFGKTGAGK